MQARTAPVAAVARIAGPRERRRRRGWPASGWRPAREVHSSKRGTRGAAVAATDATPAARGGARSYPAPTCKVCGIPSQVRCRRAGVPQRVRLRRRCLRARCFFPMSLPSGVYSCSHHFLTSSIEGAFSPSLFFLLKPHRSLKNLPGESFLSESAVR